MKKIAILLLSLLWSSFAVASVTVATQSTTALLGNSCNVSFPAGNPQGYFTIVVGWTGAMNNNNFYHFHRNGSPYRVTAGTTFKAVCVCYATSTANNRLFQLVHTLTNWSDDAGSITGGTYEYGAVDSAGYNAPVANTTYCVGKNSFQAPSLAYVGVEINGTYSHDIFVIGREE